MKFKQILSQISNFLSRHRTAITVALFVCVVMQQCTISRLSQEIVFLREKYENPIATPAASAKQLADDIAQKAGDALDGALPSEAQETSGTTTALYWVFGIAMAVVVYWLLARRFGLFPYLLNAKGRIWQDLQGRVVYTLTIKNKTRRDISVQDAMIEFMGIRDSRKFKAPTSELPMTLAPGTQHSINLPLQRLLERDQQLMNYKAIRAMVTADGKTVRALPLGVRWKK